jgi:hypothetical protein
VAAVAIESRGEGDIALQDAASSIFGRWLELMSGRLADAGIEPRRARQLAATAVAAMEGALILAEARRDIEPFDTVTAEVRGLIQSELDARG